MNTSELTIDERLVYYRASLRARYEQLSDDALAEHLTSTITKEQRRVSELIREEQARRDTKSRPENLLDSELQNSDLRRRVMLKTPSQTTEIRRSTIRQTEGHL